MRRRSVSAAVAVIVVAGPLAAAQQAQAAPSAAPAKSLEAVARAALKPQLGPGGRVIVLFKNHLTTFSAHTATQQRLARAAHSSVVSVADAIRHQGGTVTHTYSLINGLSARVSQHEADKLAADPNVARVVPDTPITESAVPSATPTPTPQSPTAPVANACASNGGTQLDPEALEATRADSDVAGAKTARSLGFTGQGVTVGWIADGMDINNPEFIRNGKTIFSDYQDFGGDGTNSPTGGDEAFLDASAIAAQGNQTYDVSHFSNLPLNTACKIRIEGEAPGVNLVGLNIFGDEDTGYNSSFIQAIQYATTVAHVNVLNESLGSNPYPDDSGALDAVKAANDAAVKQGVTITASSGDAGVTNTIGSPAGDPNVISVGASTTYRFYLQTGYGGARLPGITGWLNNNISSLTSAGFAQNTRTVDLVAPGDLNWAACTADAKQYTECTDFTGKPSNIEESGGTSESAPVTAGVAALVIQAYRKGHGGVSPTPAVVKQILTSTADDVRAPAEQQGAGLVDAYKAVQLAQSYYASTNSASNPVTPTGHTITVSKGQFNTTAAPATPKTFTETVTNSGTSSQTVTPSARTLGAYTPVKQTTVTLSDKSSAKYVDFQGYTDNLETIKFSVPKGESRLNASIAFQSSSTSPTARVRMDLVDPLGRLASYSLPQGIGNYGNGQVADPTAGTWTAYITSRDSAAGGTTGAVHFQAAVAKFVSFGKVSPTSLTLAPGKSGTVRLSTSTLGRPGDRAGALVLATSTTDTGVPGTTTVPITMRSLIPTGAQSFNDTLTGGNGRAAFTGQTFYYDIDLPKGDPALNAYVHVAHGPTNTFYAYLVAPNGNAVATGSNQVLTSIAGGTTQVGAPTLGAQLHVLKPAAGRWTLIAVFAPQVSGNATSEQIRVRTNQTAQQASVSGLPSSVTSGRTVHTRVTITNRGNSPEAFFVDPRLTSMSTYALTSLTTATSPAPFHSTDTAPQFLIPTDTVAFAAASRTTGPKDIQFDSSSPAGDPDILSGVGKTVSAAYRATPVAQGEWSVIPTEVGPFPTAGTPESVTSVAVAKTRTFDPSAVPSTGDLWLSSVDPDATLNTITVNPGETATIPVTIHATGKARTVHGTFFVDDATLFSVYGGLAPNANEVAAIPYSYKITSGK